MQDQFGNDLRGGGAGMISGGFEFGSEGILVYFYFWKNFAIHFDCAFVPIMDRIPPKTIIKSFALIRQHYVN